MLTFSEGYVVNYIYKSGGMPELDKANTLVHEYIRKCEKYYESKRNRIKTWYPSEGEINELIIAAFTLALTQAYLTYPSIVGMLADRVNGELEPFDRAKIVAEVIALMAQADLLDIDTNRPGAARISTQWSIDNIPEQDTHLVYGDIEEITSNYHETYRSMLLGGKLKHHDSAVSLDVLNKRNAVKLSLNIPLLKQVGQEVSKPLDTQDKRDQWNLFVRECYNKYIEIVNTHDNEFSIVHKYDCRGRKMGMIKRIVKEVEATNWGISGRSVKQLRAEGNTANISKK
jgi:hypothetical protein